MSIPCRTVSEPPETPADEDTSTEYKLALLLSKCPGVDKATLLDLLVSCDGSVDRALKHLTAASGLTSPRKRPYGSVGFQTSLAAFRKPPVSESDSNKRRNLTKKGRTLHLYSPEDIAQHSPCSIIHNFLPIQEAEALLRELLAEAPTYESATFKLFDNVVQSPHTACFYVHSLEEERRQKTEYLYNGSYLSDIRQITPEMRRASPKVEEAVNREINERIWSFYPDQKKLKYQSPHRWKPNAAFVNCYKGGTESVGYHSDQLTYLGPRAVIGSISLGVAREFRVRKIVAHDDEDTSNEARADAEGQIAIHLPHNSLLVMHADMQEEWKVRLALRLAVGSPSLNRHVYHQHSIHPAPAIDPHPVAGNKRINITYRWYRESFHPRFTPKCRCGVATVLRCVQRRKKNRGRYIWMCHAGNTPGKQGCTFFQWAEFDENGEPPWVTNASHRPEYSDTTSQTVCGATAAS